MTSGGRNLIVLGVASVVVAFATTGAALAVYHNSGDIYLDRSRPGYLPDKAEIEETEIEDEYVLEKSGPLTKKILDEYLEKLELEVKAVENYEKPFDATVLSDESFGIPSE